MADVIQAPMPLDPPALPTTFDKLFLWGLRQDTNVITGKIRVQAALKYYGVLDDGTKVFHPTQPMIGLSVDDLMALAADATTYPKTAAVIPALLDAIIEIGTAQGVL
jgi:hypothetical protein